MNEVMKAPNTNQKKMPLTASELKEKAREEKWLKGKRSSSEQSIMDAGRQ